MSFVKGNDLGVMSVGRSIEWLEPPSVEGAPKTDVAGVSLTTNAGYAVRTLLSISPREKAHAHQSYVRCYNADDTDTYTLTLAGAAFVYAAIALDGQTEILTGLQAAVDVGEDLLVSAINLTFAYDGYDPATITRASGAWPSNLVAGTKLRVSGSTSNDGTYTVGTVVSSTVVELIDTDTLTAEGPSAGANVYLVAHDTAIETRDGNPTLVLTHLADDASLDFTTAVSTAGAGVLEYDEDATSFDAFAWVLPSGTNSPNIWETPPGCSWTTINYRGMLERLDIAGCQRVYVEIENVSSPSTAPREITKKVSVGKAILES